MKYQYQLIDNGGICTEWDVPFKMAIGSTFEHEFGTYRVDEYKGEHVLCERVENAPQEKTPLTREILESYGFKQNFTTPDHDDRGIEFSLPNAVLEGLYICNNEPCEIEMIEGEYCTDDGDEHHVCIETKEQLDAFIALEEEKEIIEFINNLMN